MLNPSRFIRLRYQEYRRLFFGLSDIAYGFLCPYVLEDISPLTKVRKETPSSLCAVFEYLPCLIKNNTA